MGGKGEPRTCVLDKLTVVIVIPQRLEHGLVGVAVVLANERLQILRRLLAVVCNCQLQLVPIHPLRLGIKKNGGRGDYVTR